MSGPRVKVVVDLRSHPELVWHTVIIPWSRLNLKSFQDTVHLLVERVHRTQSQADGIHINLFPDGLHS